MSMDNTLILTLFLIFFSLVIQMCNPDIRVAYLCIAFGNFIFYNRYCKMVLQIDSITLLLNRKCYDANLGNMDLNSIILFFDVDNFKNVNDVYGHLIGDFCLKEISQIIREVYDKYGCCYRIGGDEFSVILSNYNGDIKILNDMFIQKLNEKCDKDSRIPDVSIGWSYYNENFSYMPDVIKEADFMMYENKRKKLK